VDSAETAGHPVAAVEAALEPCPKTDSARIGPRPCVDFRDQRSRTLVECRRKPHEPGHPDPVSAPAWSGKPSFRVAAFYAFNLNRRVRNRTHGGVGGRGRQRPLLPGGVSRGNRGLRRARRSVCGVLPNLKLIGRLQCSALTPICTRSCINRPGRDRTYDQGIMSPLL
jgi:hypothetical protein